MCDQFEKDNKYLFEQNTKMLSSRSRRQQSDLRNYLADIQSGMNHTLKEAWLSATRMWFVDLGMTNEAFCQWHWLPV